VKGKSFTTGGYSGKNFEIIGAEIVDVEIIDVEIIDVDLASLWENHSRILWARISAAKLLQSCKNHL
jgi:hypothetical protein